MNGWLVLFYAIAIYGFCRDVYRKNYWWALFSLIVGFLFTMLLPLGRGVFVLFTDLDDWLRPKTGEAK